jgi:hypothetical protein
MKKRLSNLVLSSSLMIGCGDIDGGDYGDRETVAIQEIVNEMVKRCNESPSDVNYLVCPIATANGFEGYVRYGCWSERGNIDCLDTSDHSVCKYNTDSMCVETFENNGSECGYDAEFQVLKPDVTADAFYRRSFSELDCLIQP